MAEARNPEIEARIFAKPDEPSNYLVYGDWLQSVSEPRGELIAAQAAPAKDDDARAREATLLEQHRELFFGPALDVEPQAEVEWHFGFWRSLSFPYFGWSPKPLHLDHLDTLLASPSARFLRAFEADGDLGHEVATLAAQKHRTLEELDLALRSQAINDACLGQLAGCHRLRRLHLFSCSEVTPGGMSTLREFPKLESIDLRNCPLSDAGVSHLEGLPLEAVHFNTLSPDLSAAGMAKLASLPLVQLDMIAGSQLSDDHFAALAHHPTLADIWVHEPRISAQGAGALGTLRSLRRLRIRSSTLGDEGVAKLPRTLRHLDVSHCKLSDSACASIAGMRELEVLFIGANRAISGVGLRQLTALENLHTLVLSFLELSDQALRCLRELQKLTQLSLLYLGPTDAVVDVLLELKQLKVLDLGASAITTSAIDRLRALPNLELLGLYDCPHEVIEHAKGFDNWRVYYRDGLDFHDFDDFDE